MRRCGCLVLCLCPDSWEFMRQTLSYSRDEMDARLAHAREIQQKCKEALR